ncbi:PfkB family carbohydrate kinase [Pontibacter rugosus]|uniref:Ribokinase n=1 Tax=Pontibacter rugosus TaxID=1745966 RepID=A0ABW3SUG5_9BACT
MAKRNMGKGVILSLGSAIKDIQVRAEDKAKPGETITARDLRTASGGKAANRAYYIAKLGAPSWLLARLGHDQEAVEVLKPLQEAGVQLEHVKQASGRRTGFAIIAVQPNGSEAILAVNNAHDCWEPASPAHVANVISNAPDNSILTVDLEIPADVVIAALHAAKDRNFTILIDPTPASLLQDQFYALADFLTPDISEAESMAGFAIRQPEDGIKACKAIIAKGARQALVKMGDKGYVMITADQQELYLPAPDVQMVDSTGAGDAFAAALAFALWEGQQPAQAFRFAAMASSLAVAQYGSQPSYPDKKIIDQKLVGWKV